MEGLPQRSKALFRVSTSAADIQNSVRACRSEVVRTCRKSCVHTAGNFIGDAADQRVVRAVVKAWLGREAPLKPGAGVRGKG